MEEKDSILIPLGTEVSAKFKGAFCEAKVGKLIFDGEQNSVDVSDQLVRGNLKVGEKVEAKSSPAKAFRRATVTKIWDDSTYTVDFNDGDQKTLKRNHLRIKGDKHFSEAESLDKMPLVHPEEFGSPVIGKGNLKDEIGKLVCVEVKLGNQNVLVPCLIVMFEAQGQRPKKDHCLVRSFLDNKFSNISKKDLKIFKPLDSSAQDLNGAQSKQVGKAYEKANAYRDQGILPDGWNRSSLLEAEEAVESPATTPQKQRPKSQKESASKKKLKNESESEGSSTSLSSFESEDEDGIPNEERDRFVAQLYGFMDERGTPLNKAPSIANKDLDLYRLYHIVHHCGGYSRVNRLDKWLKIYKRMHLPQCSQPRKQIVQAYTKYLQPFEEFNRKLGVASMGLSGFGRTRHESSRVFNTSRDKPVSKPTNNTPAPNTIVNTGSPTAVSKVSLTGSKSPPPQPCTAQPLTSSAPRRISAPDDSTKTSRRSRRESHSKEEEPPISLKARRGPGGRKRSSQISSKVESDGSSSSEEERQDEESQSGDDSNAPTSSTDLQRFGTTIPLSVANSAGISPTSILPLDTCVKVKCSRGNKTASYDGKITAKKREPDGVYHYYVHYKGWNSRYDEWVVAGRISDISKIGSGEADNLSRTNSVPNSVASVVESDSITTIAEEPQKVLETTKSIVSEDSPEKDNPGSSNSSTTEAQLSTSPELSNSMSNEQKVAINVGRKRKTDENVQQQTKVVEVLECKPPKIKSAENVVTRSTRGKPGEEGNKTTPGSRRGGYRAGANSNRSANGTAVVKDEQSCASEIENGTKPVSIAQLNLGSTKSPMKIATEQRRLNRPNKFDFHINELDTFESREERIAFLTKKIGEIRNLYGDLKSKAADIDKKRKLYKALLSRKEKDLRDTNNKSSGTITIKQQIQNELGFTSVTQTISVGASEVGSNDSKPRM